MAGNGTEIAATITTPMRCDRRFDLLKSRNCFPIIDWVRLILEGQIVQGIEFLGTKRFVRWIVLDPAFGGFLIQHLTAAILVKKPGHSVESLLIVTGFGFR